MILKSGSSNFNIVEVIFQHELSKYLSHRIIDGLGFFSGRGQKDPPRMLKFNLMLGHNFFSRRKNVTEFTTGRQGMNLESNVLDWLTVWKTKKHIFLKLMHCYLIKDAFLCFQVKILFETSHRSCDSFIFNKKMKRKMKPKPIIKRSKRTNKI